MPLPIHELVELRALLDALCEESITAEQIRRLEELVLTHPEAEAVYVRYMLLFADLVGHFGTRLTGTDPGPDDRTVDDSLRRCGGIRRSALLVHVLRVAGLGVSL